MHQIFIICLGLVLLCLSTVNSQTSLSYNSNSDAGLSLEKLADKYGYPVEVHRNIRTQDLYLLTLHRIPYGKSYRPDHTTNAVIGPPVLLMHGLFGGAEHFMTSGDRSLAFLLADRGYDVWMGNNRGVSHSRHHEYLNPDRDAQFWDYSFEDMSIYDMPAFIDHILKETGHEQIFYIGHSQGTSVFWALCSERPEYNARVRLMVALAPVAFSSHLPHPWLGKLVIFENQLAALRQIGINELLPGRQLMQILGQFFCANPLFVDICTIVFFTTAGPNAKQFIKGNIPTIVTTSPESISMKQFIHFLQTIRLRSFCKYDYGPTENLKRYGSILPTNFTLERVTAPVVVFYSQSDWFTSPIDIDRLLSEISSPVLKYLVSDLEFSHTDFLWAKDVVPLVYEQVFAIMDQY